MTELSDQAGQLIITADDWGYSPRYSAGIEEAARAGAVKATASPSDTIAAMTLFMTPSPPFDTTE